MIGIKFFNKNQKQGFSLLEILISITLFAIMILFISQMTRMNLRQKKKIEAIASGQREINAITQILFKDFRNINLFFDFNQSFGKIYAPKDSQTSELQVAASFTSFPSGNSTNQNEDEFNFIGSEKEIQFPSFSIKDRKKNEIIREQVYIKYFLQTCKSLEEETTSTCLYRALLDTKDNNQIKEKLVLLRNIQSFKLSYYNLKDEEWKSSWEGEPIKFLDNLNQKNVEKAEISDDEAEPLLFDEVYSLFPSSVKMDIEWGQQKIYKKSYTFPVSYPLFAYRGNFRLMQIYSNLAVKKAKENDELDEYKPTKTVRVKIPDENPDEDVQKETPKGPPSKNASPEEQFKYLHDQLKNRGNAQ